MSINVTSLDSLDSTAVAASEAILKELLNEQFPNLDLTAGSILQQLMTEPNSLLDVMNKTEINNLRRSMSLKAIAEDPELADDDIVDSVMSNYQISRRASTSALGVMAIVIDSLSTTIITTTTTFIANGRTFNPDQDYTALTNVTLVTADNEREILQRADGKYWFTINVVENITGGSIIAQGTNFVVSSKPAGFSEAYAALDFQAGIPAEDNTKLIGQLDEGIAARAMADRVSIDALLYNNFSTLIDTSIIGFGDNEMLRDAYNIFGISHGGTVDIYVRTAPSPYTQKISIAMVPSNTVDDTGGFQVVGDFIIPPDVIPGLYRVTNVTPYDPASLVNSLQSFAEVGDRGIYTPTDIEHRPLLNTAEDARFTMFQGVTRIRTTDAQSIQDHEAIILAAVSGLDSITVYYNGILTTFLVEEDAESANISVPGALRQGVRFYDAYVTYIPEIKAIQDYTNNRERRAPGADYLVKAAIPCTVAVDVVVAYNAEGAVPDINELKAQISVDINAVKFEAPDLPAATVVDAVTKVLGTEGYAKLPLTLRGSIQLPSGDIQLIESQSALVIPENDALGVTKRTTAFYSVTDDINMTLQAVSKWNV